MPEHVGNLPLQTIQRAAFVLPGTVAQGVRYLSEPAIILAALPSVERVIARQQGTFRIILAPIQFPGLSLRPAAEVTFATTADRVTIASITEEPHALQPGEVAARVLGVFNLTPTPTGCAVQATLRIDANIPARILPPFMPRMIAHRTAEALLVRRMRQEITTMTQQLIQGYPGWEVQGSS